MPEALRRAVDGHADLESEPGVPGLVARIQHVIDGAPPEREAEEPGFVVKKGPVGKRERRSTRRLRLIACLTETRSG